MNEDVKGSDFAKIPPEIGHPVIASLIETCKLNGVDPQAYMANVLTKIVNGHLASELDELMPWAYATSIALRDVA